MGNCFASPSPRRRRRHVSAAVTSEPANDGLGHSFCYISSKVNADFFSISGASVSANTSTALSTSLDLNSYTIPASFDSSNRFSSIPLQPIPRFLSGPIPNVGFLSGPIERGFLSGPLEAELTSSNRLKRSVSLHKLYKAISETVGGRGIEETGKMNSGDNCGGFLSGPLDVKPTSSNLRRLYKSIYRTVGGRKFSGTSKELNSAENSSGFISIDEVTDAKDGNLEWAQGKAGEDRVHVVISEGKGWVFVGIYDGFNGPDATDYLSTNLYSEVDKELEKLNLGDGMYDHYEVLKALSQALMKTEEAFLDCADMMLSENPELALMGSCVLVMLMIGEDVYLMNVGDSRAVLGTKAKKDWEMDELLNLGALQLIIDHSTSIKEEVTSIRKEHPDDSLAIVNDHVKGSLKVTRAFGAGFLKQLKWNNVLLEMFRIDYIGTSPYVTCNPSLYHHRLSANDKFLILSSDGLYQYFTNEEAVAEAELFISTTPEGDPAQHLLEELLFRAAKKANMKVLFQLVMPLCSPAKLCRTVQIPTYHGKCLLPSYLEVYCLNNFSANVVPTNLYLINMMDSSILVTKSF